MTFKAQIVAQYELRIQDKVDAFQDMIAALSADSKNDAKGSAGDKHETALSMMHIEQEKLSFKLQECLNDHEAFSKIDFTKTHRKVQVGSLVLANSSYFLIAIALPKITVQGMTVFGISPHSPLAQALIGRTAGETFTVNTTHYLIHEVM